MSDKQVRAYITLLCYSWLEQPRATLPNDNAQIAQLVHMSEEEWNQIKAPVLAKFESDGNGRIFNERLMEESCYFDKKSEAGKAGWTQKRRSAVSRNASKKTSTRSSGKSSK